MLGGWFTATAVIAGHGWYHTRLGHGVPWLPIAVAGFFGLLLALRRIPVVARALAAPGLASRLEYPHLFRVEGVAFLIMPPARSLPKLADHVLGHDRVPGVVHVAALMGGHGRAQLAGHLQRLRVGRAGQEDPGPAGVQDGARPFLAPPRLELGDPDDYLAFAQMLLGGHKRRAGLHFGARCPRKIPPDQHLRVTPGAARSS